MEELQESSEKPAEILQKVSGEKVRFQVLVESTLFGQICSHQVPLPSKNNVWKRDFLTVTCKIPWQINPKILIKLDGFTIEEVKYH